MSQEVESIERVATDKTFQARLIKRPDREIAQKFYLSLGHFTVIQPMDHVFGIYNESANLVGVARVTPEFDALILKGVVFEDPSIEVSAMKELLPAVIGQLERQKFYALVDQQHLKEWEEMGLKVLPNEKDLSEHLLKRRDFGLKRDSRLCWVVWNPR